MIPLYNRENYRGHNQIQLLGSRNITCFPTPYIHTLLRALTVPPVLPHISRIVSTGSFPSHDFFPS